MEGVKSKLTAEAAVVTKELEKIATYEQSTGDWQAMPAGPADDADENEAADDTEDSTERQAIVAELETRYRNITKALLKLENGKYGLCELCGQEIEIDRITVNPAARTCIRDRDRESELSI